MKFCKPYVTAVASTQLKEEGLAEVFDQYGAEAWFMENVKNEHGASDEELLVEVMARSCYKSFGAGLNPNVTKVREGNGEYLANVIDSGHGSVLEHSNVSFMFQDVSRVFTHELVRHRVGTAISQESLRYVRLTDLKCFDFPRLEEELTEHEEEWFRNKVQYVFEQLEKVQKEMSEKFNLNNEKSFARKKKLTSRMRRLAPIGLLTNIGWSANLRTLRQVIPLRTSKAAEEEIRHVFADVGSICKREYPHVFFDMEWFTDGDKTGLGEWRMVPKCVREISKFATITEKDGLHCITVGGVPMYRSKDKLAVELNYRELVTAMTEWAMK